MKNIIVTVSLILVILFYEAFQGDFNGMLRHQEMIKDKADLATSSAMLAIDPVFYGDGWIVYKYDEANRQINDIMQKNKIVSKYMNDSYRIYTYFFDYDGISIGESGVSKGRVHSYVDSVQTDVKTFTWGDRAASFTDIKKKTGRDFVVNTPCAACFVDRGRIMKLSVYEYKTD